jgi:hypothetical protein
MNSKILATIFIVLGLAVGYAALAGAEATGIATPVITQAFASKELRAGDTWKVYLKSSELGGDMRYIVSTLYQPGWGDYPVSRTKIREENRKELNGYIYLNTLIPGGYNFLNFHPIILTVQIQDKAGHYSKPMEFSLYFDPRANVQEEPPNGVFKEQALGPIMVNLHPFDVGGGSDRN